MRTLTTILFLLTLFCNAHAKTTTTQQCWGNHITLNGHYNENADNHAQKRSVPILPILASIDGADLYFEFSTSISDLSITVIKDGAEVISKTITVEAEQCETFDLSEYGAGSYQVVLTTPQGTNLSGEFNL